jgi:hypothetical protein
MKKLFASTILAASLFVTPVLAEGEIFYDGGVEGAWNIFGNAGSTTQNPACVAEVTWQDGSKFQLIKDLADGELYIWFKNNEWNISDPPGNYPFTMNIVDSRGNVINGELQYELINKNTIAVRKIDVDSFIPPFMSMAEMRFVMPGDIQNAYVTLNGSSGAVDKLLACIDTFEKKRPAPAPAQPPADQPKKSLGQEI